MTLTTHDGTKLGQNIVSDPNANVAVPAGPTRQISPDAAILFDKSIIARPLGVPQVCEIQIKNLEYRYRWVNRDALGGRVFTQRRAQGFMLATPDDVEVMSADSEAKDGEIRAGDVVLMKIRKDLYDSAMKANMVKAQVLSRARGLYQEGGSPDVNSNEVANRKTISADPGVRTGQAPAFIPENVDRMIDDSIKSGRAEQTRAAVEELRTSAKGPAKS